MHSLRPSSVFSHLLLVGLLFLSINSLAQTNEVKVKMKSGLTISGELEAISQGDYVEVKTPVGTVIHLNWDEIDELNFSPDTHIKVTQGGERERRPDLAYNDSTFYLKASLGFPFGTDIDGDPSVCLSASATVGRAFSQHLRVGLTTGYDWYWWPHTGFVPVGLELQTRFQESGFSPYLYGRGGYGIVTYSDYEVFSSGETKGGAFWGLGFGFTHKRRKQGAFFLEFGVRGQYSSAEYWDHVFDDFGAHPAFIQESLGFHRMDLKFGFCFE